jgi:hypothetical protein
LLLGLDVLAMLKKTIKLGSGLRCPDISRLEVTKTSHSFVKHVNWVNWVNWVILNMLDIA